MSVSEWLLALLAIVLVDLLLAGDNAVVIAMAARRLPAEMRKRAVFWGTAGAIVIRVALAVVAVALLQVRGLGVVGGLLLVIVAVRLMTPGAEDSEEVEEGEVSVGMWSAMGSIVVADVVMGLDNILAIAGAARGDYWLIGIGLALSIPIMVAGSLIILRYMERAPWLVYVGGALLVFIAARMGLDDKLASETLLWTADAEWAAVATATLGITGACAMWQKSRRKRRARIAERRHGDRRKGGKS